MRSNETTSDHSSPGLRERLPLTDSQCTLQASVSVTLLLIDSTGYQDIPDSSMHICTLYANLSPQGTNFKYLDTTARFSALKLEQTSMDRSMNPINEVTLCLALRGRCGP